MTRPILVVEDDDAIRELLHDLLTMEGYEVETVDNGIAALQKLNHRLPALILLDLMLPRMDGPTFIKEMERRGLRSSVIILALSAASPAGLSAEELDVEGFLPKPFDLQAVLDQVETLMAAGRRHTKGRSVIPLPDRQADPAVDTADLKRRAA